MMAAWDGLRAALRDALLALAPIGYWPLDAADAGGIARDDSGHGLHGAYVGAVPGATTLWHGEATAIGIGGQIEISVSRPPAWTLAALVRSGGGRLLDWGVWLRLGDPVEAWLNPGAFPGGGLGEFGPLPLEFDADALLLVRNDDATGVLSVDLLLPSGAGRRLSYGGANTPAELLVLGNRPDGGEPLAGALAQVALYDRALDDDEVAMLRAGLCAALAGLGTAGAAASLSGRPALQAAGRSDLRRAHFGVGVGPAVLSGTLRVGAVGDYAARTVRLYHRVTGRFAGETRSDAAGAWRLAALDPSARYVAVGLDDEPIRYEADAADQLIPTREPSS